MVYIYNHYILFCLVLSLQNMCAAQAGKCFQVILSSWQRPCSPLQWYTEKLRETFELIQRTLWPHSSAARTLLLSHFPFHFCSLLLPESYLQIRFLNSPVIVSSHEPICWDLQSGNLIIEKKLLQEWGWISWIVFCFHFSSNLDAYYVCDFWPQAINLRALLLQMPLTFLCDHYQWRLFLNNIFFCNPFY